MRIAIHTLGTRGDVQPYVALARSLKSRGHQVQLAAPVQFSEFAADHSVSFRGLPAEFLALLNTAEGKAAVAGGKGFSAGFKLLKEVRPLIRKLLDGEWQMANDFGPDLIVYHPKSIAAPYIASALDVPHVLASPVPGLTPTSAFPSPLLPFSSLGPFNRVSHSLAIHAAELLFARELKAWRKGTPGLDDQLKRKSRAGTLYAYSPAVLPKPDDWGPDVLVTGYWFLDEPGWPPDPDLEAFLDAGPPPVYFGFGSMPGLDPEQLTGIILDALAVTDTRGLLAVGGGAVSLCSKS
jgi:sterol 3beta-glucosyltransferase